MVEYLLDVQVVTGSSPVAFSNPEETGRRVLGFEHVSSTELSVVFAGYRE